jgi:uncharacterized OB-fold protein
MASIHFTKNFTDHSNDTGFQFEFHCDKCGNGYRSSFVTNKLGMAANLLKAAGSIFGGSLSSAGWGADHVKDAFRGKAWDDAFADAITEIKPKLKQCTRCGKWVCPEVCWNEKRNLCEECAPDLAEAAAAIQAQVAVEQAWDKARKTDQVEALDMKAQQVSGCPHCGAHIDTGAKFCPECGKAIVTKASGSCAKCGTKFTSSSKFCPECGTPRA